MFLAFDTETTGLPKSWRAHPSKVENWPRVVQLAWEFYDLCGRKVLGRCDLIKPVGFTIPRDAQAIHGISTAVARSRGVPIAEALDAFMRPLRVASVVVAHNLKFDANILGAEFHRMRRDDPLPRKTQVCTMLASAEFRLEHLRHTPARHTLCARAVASDGQAAVTMRPNSRCTRRPLRWQQAAAGERDR